jgi:2-polyprenyl-3-methyl-5-hydroxy-6-metoxy-1,4-benzoquinol methylase
MPDEQTQAAYAANAAAYSRNWLEQPEPTDLYARFERFFHKGGATADVGCGNGRDAAWLAAHGYPVVGYDASAELLAEARHLFPGLSFAQANLPRLTEIVRQFDNVVCETVIMHLAQAEITEAVRNLQRLLKPGGVLYLSWRVTEGADKRDANGRLYAAFDPGFVREQLTACEILLLEDVVSVSSGKRICRIVARRPSDQFAA